MVSNDPEDTKLSTSDFATAYFNATKSALKNAPVKAGDSKITCEWTAPSIETKAYGLNQVTTLTYLQVCNKSGWDGPKWSQPVYAFTKSASSGNLLAIYFDNANKFIMKAGASDVDPTKAMSVSFLEQFLKKLKFN